MHGLTIPDDEEAKEDDGNSLTDSEAQTHD